MADPIILTPQPVVVTGAAVWQDINQVFDVSAYDQLDLQLGVLSVAGSGAITVDIVTSMQKAYDDFNKTPSAWSFKAGATGLAASAVGYTGQSFPNGTGLLLRYIRWNVSAFSGFTSVQFVIQGMARRKSF